MIKNKKIDTEGNQVKWLQISWMQYQKAEPNIIFFKYDKSEPTFHKIEITRSLRKHSIADLSLTQAYTGPLTIKMEKIKDLKELCDSGIIRNQYHQFYRTLISSHEEASNDFEEDEEDE